MDLQLSNNGCLCSDDMDCASHINKANTVHQVDEDEGHNDHVVGGVKEEFEQFIVVPTSTSSSATGVVVEGEPDSRNDPVLGVIDENGRIMSFNSFVNAAAEHQQHQSQIRFGTSSTNKSSQNDDNITTIMSLDQEVATVVSLPHQAAAAVTGIINNHTTTSNQYTMANPSQQQQHYIPITLASSDNSTSAAVSVAPPPPQIILSPQAQQRLSPDSSTVTPPVEDNNNLANNGNNNGTSSSSDHSSNPGIPATAFSVAGRSRRKAPSKRKSTNR